jgi:hypothetical protein
MTYYLQTLPFSLVLHSSLLQFTLCSVISFYTHQCTTLIIPWMISPKLISASVITPHSDSFYSFTLLVNLTWLLLNLSIQTYVTPIFTSLQTLKQISTFSLIECCISNTLRPWHDANNMKVKWNEFHTYQPNWVNLSIKQQTNQLDILKEKPVQSCNLISIL